MGSTTLEMPRKIAGMTFSEKFKRLEAASDFPNREMLAEALGVSSSTVRRWTRGEASPTLKDLYKIAELFDVSIIYLVEDEATEMHPVVVVGDEKMLIEAYRQLLKNLEASGREKVTGLQAGMHLNGLESPFRQRSG